MSCLILKWILGAWGAFWSSWIGLWGHFGSLELPLERLGRHLGFILGVLGCCGDPFWRSGGAPGRLRRAIASKDRWSLLAPTHFKRFGRLKGAQKAPKMELKSVKNGFKNWVTFLFDFLSVSEAFFDDFWEVFETLDLHK